MSDAPWPLNLLIGQSPCEHVFIVDTQTLNKTVWKCLKCGITKTVKEVNAMTEEKKPQVGDEFLYQDDEDDWATGVIKTVGAFDEENGMYAVTDDEGEDRYLYWDATDGWLDGGN